MGWCPKLQYLAQYDKGFEINRLIFTILIGVIIFSLSFVIFMQTSILRHTVGPDDIENSNPILVAYNNELFLFVKSRLRVMDSYINYVAKINLNGEVVDMWRLDVEGDIGDILISRNGTWYMAYVSNGIKVCSSKDGIHWSKPIIIVEDEKYANGYVKYNRPSLTEMEDGGIFLSFTKFEQKMSTLEGYDFRNRSLEVYYTIFDGVDWSEPKYISVLKPTKFIRTGRYGGSNIYWKECEISDLQPSCFTLKDGSIGIVAVDQDVKAYEIRGIWFTYLNENGTWSKPIHLSLGTAYFSGVNPKVFYSFSRDGYFLLFETHVSQDVLFVTFSPDLKKWGKITTFPIWPTHSSITELQNGTIVLTYEKFPHVYISSNNEDNIWSLPKMIEPIIEERLIKRYEFKIKINMALLFGFILGLTSMFIHLIVLKCGKEGGYSLRKMCSGSICLLSSSSSLSVGGSAGSASSTLMSKAVFRFMSSGVTPSSA